MIVALPEADEPSRRPETHVRNFEPCGAREGHPLYVMNKSGDSWRIAVGQNTKCQSESIAAQTQGLKDRK